MELAYGQAKILQPAHITVFGPESHDYFIPSLAQQIGFDHKIIEKIKNGGFPYQKGGFHYLLKNIDSPCYQNMQGNYHELVCQNPQEYFFYDRIHTTKYVNEILAEDVYHFLNLFSSAKANPAVFK